MIIIFLGEINFFVLCIKQSFVFFPAFEEGVKARNNFQNKMNMLPTRLLLASFFIGIFFLVTVFSSCTSKTDVSLSPKFPVHDIDYSGTIAEIQAQFDKEQWESFIALCWPADGLKPIFNGNILDNTDDRPVFENYAFNYDLFLLNLRNETTKYRPVDWGDHESLDKQRRARWTKDCPNLISQAEKEGITNLASIIPLDEFIQASNGAKPHVPVIDHNGKYVWSSVVFNETTFDFVNDADLFLWKGINEAKKNFVEKRVYTVDKDVITFEKKKYNQLKDDNGSMHLKTSWKIMGEGDDPSKFHTAWGAQIFNNVNFADTTTIVPQCSLVQVGLVGMHISYKTEDQQGFIWSTFEHIDNCPERGDIEDKHYNFFDYADRKTKVNNQPPKANENINHDPIIVASKDTFVHPKWFNPFTDSKNDASQIVRYDSITIPTKALNRYYQQALGNTVWANYELVSTQWTKPETEVYYPKRLYNTTLESFDQKGSSCIGCHHQLLPNTLLVGPNKDQYFMEPDTIGNILNLPLNLFKEGLHPDTAVYSDYMYSMLKWKEDGHLTWRQIKKGKKP